MTWSRERNRERERTKERERQEREREDETMGILQGGIWREGGDNWTVSFVHFCNYSTYCCVCIDIFVFIYFV